MASAKYHLLDVYNAHLYRVTDKRQWATLRRKLTFLDKEPDAAGLSQFATFVPDKVGLTEPFVVIWIDIKQHPSTIDLIDTAAHEASHAAGELLEHIGHDHRGVDEPHAYLVGWLTRWILDDLIQP